MFFNFYAIIVVTMEDLLVADDLKLWHLLKNSDVEFSWLTSINAVFPLFAMDCRVCSMLLKISPKKQVL